MFMFRRGVVEWGEMQGGGGGRGVKTLFKLSFLSSLYSVVKF